MIAPSWMGPAADEIVNGERNSFAIIKILVKHYPVPRCDGCKLWTRQSFGVRMMSTFGYCNVLPSSANIMSTREDFGCVRWEAK